MSSIESKLGDEVKCTITGLSGTAVCHLYYINGCNQIGIQSKAVKSIIPSVAWIDEQNIKVVKAKRVTKILISDRMKKKRLKKVGGPSRGPCGDER